MQDGIQNTCFLLLKAEGNKDKNFKKQTNKKPQWLLSSASLLSFLLSFRPKKSEAKKIPDKKCLVIDLNHEGDSFHVLVWVALDASLIPVSQTSLRIIWLGNPLKWKPLDKEITFLTNLQKFKMISQFKLYHTGIKKSHHIFYRPFFGYHVTLVWIHWVFYMSNTRNHISWNSTQNLSKLRLCLRSVLAIFRVKCKTEKEESNTATTGKGGQNFMSKKVKL